MQSTRLTVRGMLIAMTGLVLAAMLAISFVGLYNAHQLGAAVDHTGDTGQAVRRQMDADMMHDAIRSDVLAALLASRDGQRDKAAKIGQELAAHIDRLKQNITANAKAGLSKAAGTQAEAAIPVLERYGEHARVIVAATAAGNQTTGSELEAFEQDFDALEEAMEKLSDLIQQEAEGAKTSAHERVAGSRINTLVILVVAMVAFGLLAGFIFRRIVHPLALMARTAEEIRVSGNLGLRVPAAQDNEIGDTVQAFNALLDSLQAIVREVRDNSAQILQFGKNLVDTAQQTAGASENQSQAASGMAAAMEQLSVSIDAMSEHAQAATRASHESGRLVVEGVEVVGQASAEIGRIAESVQASSQTIQILGAKTEEITRIVSVIRDIADQTNLLALNAAIEAARAGEQGRGFAVVADEVRKLAERTAKSTGEISAMIGEIQQGAQQAVVAMADGVKRVDSGVERASQAGASVRRISAMAEEAARAVADITGALHEQSAAGRDIARNVERVAQMSEQLHGSADLSAQQARSLTQLARSLEASVGRFQV